MWATEAAYSLLGLCHRCCLLLLQEKVVRCYSDNQRITGVINASSTSKHSPGARTRLFCADVLCLWLQTAAVLAFVLSLHHWVCRTGVVMFGFVLEHILCCIHSLSSTLPNLLLIYWQQDVHKFPLMLAIVSSKLPRCHCSANWMHKEYRRLYWLWVGTIHEQCQTVICNAICTSMTTNAEVVMLLPTSEHL